jgi:hypothetical protein
MAEEVNINIKISSNLDTTADKAVKGIDKITDAAAEATQGTKQLGESSEGAITLIDEAFGGIGTKLKNVKQGLTALKTGFTASFKAGVQGASSLQKALIATGIGALVVAVGLLVAYWDDIVGFISGASSEQKQLLADTEKTAQAQQAALDAISLQENSLRLAGKSEKEIRDLKIQQTNETITALEAQLQAQETIKKSQVDASKRNREILQGIIRFLTLPLSTLLATVDMVGKALGQDFGLEQKFTGGLASLVFDPEEVAEAADETIKETQDQLAKLKSARDGFLVQDKKERADAAKAASDQAAKDAEARIAKEKETQAAIAALNKETLDLIAANQEAALKDETERENTRFANLQAKLTREREEQIKAAEGNQVLIAAINAKYDALGVQAEQAHATTLESISKASQDKLNAQLQQAADIRTSLIANEQERELATIRAKYEQDLLAAEKNEELKAALTARYEADKFAIKKNYTDQESKLRRDTLNAELDVVKGAFDAIGQIAGEQSVLGKASAVASAVINTYQAATNALANTPAPPPFPQIAAGVAIASGLASVRKILQTPVPDGNGGLSSGGGGGSLPSAPTIQQPQFNVVGQSGTNQLAQSIGGQFSQPIRAYVVGGDVTTSQQLERQRVKTATFG